MTCRHRPGDPDCSSHPNNVRAEAYRQVERSHTQTVTDLEREIVALRAQISPTPDSKNYDVVEVEEVGRCVVMKVRYPNCAKCSYEGLKVMVFSNVTIKDAIRWKKIDPHFRKPGTAAAYDAPSPVARFPGSDDGWRDALAYAQEKDGRLPHPHASVTDV